MPRLGPLAVLAVLAVSCTTERPLGAPPSRIGVASASLDALSSAPPLVFITELMPDPTKVADAAGEWFEVFNAGNTPVDLNGWRIVSGPTGSEQHPIAASVVIALGGYAVLGNNTNSFTNGGLVEQYSYGTAITLNNSNPGTDWLVLKLPDGTVVDSVSYSARSGSTIVPPIYSPSAGISRALKPAALPQPHGIMGDTVNWANTPTGTTYGLGDRGTPGTGAYEPLVPGGEVVTVTVTPDPATAVIGHTLLFAATGRDVNGAVSITTFTWASADASVAMIDAATGLATALTPGTTKISATAANGIADTATLTVSLPVVASITVAINTPREVPVGFVKPAFPTVKDAGGGTISPTPALTWTSSDPTIASVDGDGYVTGRATGTVTITATAANGVFGSNMITVDPAIVPTSAVYRNHVAFGVPFDGDPSDDILITRPQYELSYSPVRGAPNWVSWDLNATQFGPSSRCDCFSPDPALPAGVYHVVDADYRNGLGGVIDRGHMTMSEERTTTYQENATTFYLTNVLPQASENNQGPWLDFEIYLNTLARDSSKEVYVIAGGQYGPTPRTLKNEGKVQIPDYTWKIAVVLPAGQGFADVHRMKDLRVIAVRIPNDTTPGVPASAVGIKPLKWPVFQTTVDAIEAATGYDFLDLLPDATEGPIEQGDHAPTALLAPVAPSLAGSPVSFSAAESTDPDGDALSYGWDFGDGAAGTGQTPSHTYADNGTYAVRLVVSDPAGAPDTATAALTIANVPPAVAPFAGASLIAGETYTTTGSFADPGADQWTGAVNYGDGGGSGPLALSEKAFTLTHTYAAAGTFTVTVTVTDNDGGQGSRAATVNVATPTAAAQAVMGQVRGLAAAGELPPQLVTPLLAILTAAVRQIERGNSTAAIEQLDAFLNQVDAAVRSAKLASGAAQLLRLSVERIEGVLAIEA